MTDDHHPATQTANYRFMLDFSVRDYECDMQGIVNNAVYQNYLEHTRHEFLQSVGLDFDRFTRDGIHLVVVRAELDYKQPLKSGDRFWIGLNIQRQSRLKFVFLQDIYRSSDERLIMKARITASGLNARGRPWFPPELAAAIYHVDR